MNLPATLLKIWSKDLSNEIGRAQSSSPEPGAAQWNGLPLREQVIPVSRLGTSPPCHCTGQGNRHDAKTLPRLCTKSLPFGRDYQT